jgi:ATP-dependent 26S proteasome regulatory subunit
MHNLLLSFIVGLVCFIWFTYCREHAPSIIFMDEIDSIGSARMESGTGNGDSEVQRTMLELLNQLDGFEASNKIKVHNHLCSFAMN